MKKKALALLLGGVMAVGGLSMQVPVTVQAAKMNCDDYSATHIRSGQVTTVDGRLTVIIDVELEAEDGSFSLYVYDKPLEKTSDPMFYPEDYYDTRFGEGAVAMSESIEKSGTYTFDDLAGGKTYYESPVTRPRKPRSQNRIPLRFCKTAVRQTACPCGLCASSW